MPTSFPLTASSNHQLLIAPSILSADFADLGQQVRAVSDAGADWIHLDVMDGHFVPNLTIGPAVVSAIRKYSDRCFDAHLMISQPQRYIKPFADAGVDHITFHLESEGDPGKTIDLIRSCGCTAGITLKPATDPRRLFELLPLVDMVLIMTVEPGFGGQSFRRDQMDKISAVRTAIGQSGRNVHLEVDGGLDASTVAEATQAGANAIVAGTAVFRHKDGLRAGIHALRSNATPHP